MNEQLHHYDANNDSAQTLLHVWLGIKATKRASFFSYWVFDQARDNSSKMAERELHSFLCIYVNVDKNRYFRLLTNYDR